MRYAGVAQLAVHAICNREVDGSIPFAGSIVEILNMSKR